MPDTLRVLSLDGGGIRGIVPALVLAAIEEETGHPIAEDFDLIASVTGQPVRWAAPQGSLR